MKYTLIILLLEIIQIKIYIEVIIKVCFLFLLELIDITITDVIKHYVKFTY